MKNIQATLLKVLSIASFPLLFAGILIGIFFNFKPIFDFFSDPESVKSFISSTGVFGPLIFIGLQIIQVVIFIIPGEVPQIAGGFLFGPVFGTLLSIAGIIIGSGINFFLGRLLGIPFVKALFKKEQIDKLLSLFSSSKSQKITTLAIFGIFLIPAFPKDIVTYIAGLTPIRFTVFLLVSGLGRLPGILVSGLIGDAASNQNWFLVIVISVIGIALFVIGFLFRDKIFSFMKSKMKHREAGEEDIDSGKNNNTDEPKQ